VNRYDPVAVAATAEAAAAERPAVTVVHDHEDARLVVFRISPGQRVATHTNSSSVFLTVMAGAGYVTGADGEEPVATGHIVAFGPDEPHGMHAGTTELVVAALITPRPRNR